MRAFEVNNDRQIRCLGFFGGIGGRRFGQKRIRQIKLETRSILIRGESQDWACDYYMRNSC